MVYVWPKISIVKQGGGGTITTFLLCLVHLLTYCNVFGTFCCFLVNYFNVFGYFRLFSVLNFFWMIYCNFFSTFCCIRYFSVVFGTYSDLL